MKNTAKYNGKSKGFIGEFFTKGLTEGKEYEVIRTSYYGFSIFIRADDGIVRCYGKYLFD